MVHPAYWQGLPIWWNLFEGHEMLVVFGRKICCRIQSSPESSEPFCSSWDNVPVGQHILTANVPCLQHLRRIMCVKNRGLQAQLMLSDKVGWARPAGSRLFEHLYTRSRLHSSANNADGIQRSDVAAQGRMLASTNSP